MAPKLRKKNCDLPEVKQGSLYEKMTVPTLREICKLKGLPTKGSKRALVDRLNTLDQLNSSDKGNSPAPETDDKDDDYEDVDKRSQMSGRSHRSNESHASNFVERQKAKAAKLKVELTYVNREASVRAEEEKLRIEKELAIAEAQISALASSQCGANTANPNKDRSIEESPKNSSDELSSPGVPDVQFAEQPQEQANLAKAPLQDVDQPLTSNAKSDFISDKGTNQLTRNSDSVFLEAIALSRRPPPEPPVFKGDPLKYPMWKAAFTALIDDVSCNVSHKMHYLQKYVAGDARQVIEGLFYFDTDSAYLEARRLLDKRFGDVFLVTEAFRRKLDSWPKIGPKDPRELQRFVDFLRQCLLASSQVKGLNILDDCRENQALLKKCPDWLISRWGRRVSDWRSKYSTFPPFSTFVEFLEKEVDIAIDPITSVFGVKGESKPSRHNDGATRCLATGSQREVRCICCNFSGHSLSSCRKFESMSVDAKQEFIKKKGLCFACLSHGHRANSCKHRMKCDKCAKSHPTVLHPPKSSSTPPASNSPPPLANRPPPVYPEAGKAEAGKADNEGAVYSHKLSIKEAFSTKSTMIVPVWVFPENDTGNRVLTYALLDTQSDATFVISNIQHRLNVQGKPTKLNLSTMSSTETIFTTKLSGLCVQGYNHSDIVRLPTLYTRDDIPVNKSHIPTSIIAQEWPHLSKLVDELSSSVLDIDIGLLIGYNCPQALEPIEVVASENGGPYGQKTLLGWSIIGNLSDDVASFSICHRQSLSEIAFRPKVKEVFLEKTIRALERDFTDTESPDTAYSMEDRQFLDILDRGISIRQDGHYEMPLPLREYPDLPDNRSMAVQRLYGLRKRLEKNSAFSKEYVAFMENIISLGYAEPVPIESSPTEVWYIPHHGVFHHLKPNKIRVVFDASASFEGVSLNKRLLQGPDLSNSLLGLLCRFRKETVAVMCDIKQMFFQFGVNNEDRDYLRFLWWPGGDLSLDPKEYRMTVHVFGATSSPGCANYGLKRLAEDTKGVYGDDVSRFLSRDFYVDDGLLSSSSIERATSLMRRTQRACESAGMTLHKFVSNERAVVNALCKENQRDKVEVDLLENHQSIGRALGVAWCIDSDTFQFRITLKDSPLTRRGILSTVSSLYDPIGLVAPVLLEGKLILQLMCKDNIDWDSPLPDSLYHRWEKWRRTLVDLEKLSVPRCFKATGFGENCSVELHHFSDASSLGYGQSSYLRLIDDKGQMNCSLVLAKSRVVPLKQLTIPRLELVAAALSVRTSKFLNTELDYQDIRHFFWTDSKVVLGYVSNDSRRFHTFVANRVSQIRQESDPKQWRYVKTAENPADIASRGIAAKDIVNNDLWWKGPLFLQAPDEVSEHTINTTLPPDDPEVKVHSHAVDVEDIVPEDFDISRFSSLDKLIAVMATCMRWRLPRKHETNPNEYLQCNVSEIEDARIRILKHIQQLSFAEELRVLICLGKNDDRSTVRKRNQQIKTTSCLFRLDPFVDDQGVLRVGGRIKRSDISDDVKHPIIVPRRHHVATLLIRSHHEKLHHQGRAATVNSLRSSGYWIIGCSSAVAGYIKDCVICRRRHGNLQSQKMADLPEDRLTTAPAFTYCGVDLFGPFVIKEGRKEMKRYGVLFTCLASRAVHIETASSLETDSFIQALRRFIAIRGAVRVLRSDRGTNMVGASNELSRALDEMSDEVKGFLLSQGCDFEVSFKFNPPHASNMGGVWERQIRSTRRVLNTLLLQSGSQLDDESLRTFLYEAASVINCRPLTIENLNDPTSPVPLSPNNILTMKSGVILPPPGNFVQPDLYLRKRWRRVQYLTNQFWFRWKLEFLQSLQNRSKWVRPRRDLKEGDIVLISDEKISRNCWPLGIVSSAIPSEDGHVRKVKVIVNGDTRKQVVERPVNKVVVLVENDNN